MPTSIARAILAAAIAVAGAALPAGGEELTLARAMELARGRAREVTAAQALLEASRQDLRQARGHRLPSVSFQEIWMRTDSPAEAFALTLNQERFSFGDFVAGDPNAPDPVTAATTRLEVSLPLYTGGELAGRIRQAELAAEAAGEDLSWAGDRAALAAARAYVLLAQAREQVELLERSLETVQAHVELARAYVEEGMLVRSELLRAEVERSRIEDFLAGARGQARVAQAHLSFTLAQDLAGSWELSPLAVPPSLADDLEGWLSTAEERGDLTAARRRLAIAERQARVERSALYPRLGLVARGDLVDDKPFGDHGDSTAVMAVGSLELFAGGTHRAAAAAAEARAEAAAADVERFAEGVRLAVRQAFEEAVTARERHRTAESALAAAREAERITRERFGQGVVKTLDLLDAGTALREAETRELVARAEARLASLELAVAAGRTPESTLSAPGTPPSTDSAGPGAGR